MTWRCQTCTYININDRADRCHTCRTARGTARARAAPSAPAIVDLTEMCSPNPSRSVPDAAGAGEHVGRGRRGGMESNRRRRRRERRRETNSRKADEGDEQFAADGRGNLDDGAARTTKNAFGRSVTSRSSNESTKRKTKEMDEVDGNGDRKREGEDENDVLMDPAPRRELRLNLDQKSVEQGKRGESKLRKRRKVGDGTKSSSSAEQLLHPNKWGPFGESTSMSENDHNKRPIAPSAQSKTGQHSSNEGGRGGRGRKNQPGPSLAKYFNDPRKQPRASAEELLEQAKAILQQTFNHRSLRPLQETAVKGALRKKSQIVIMATGGGKSICYQLPALVGKNVNASERAENSSVTIVVCPLIALMADQVMNLHKKGVRTAVCWSSSHSAREKDEILNRLQTEKRKGRESAKLTPIQLLYCTPELLQTERFRSILTKLYKTNRLHMFAIDEAHCMSTWGHDFRPAFRKLTWLRDEYQDVPFMACTGTATAKVIEDIRMILQFDKSVPCIMGTFNRENIRYEVRFKDSLNATKSDGAMADLVEVVKAQHAAAKKRNEPCSGIIYVHKREDCSSLAARVGKATGLVCLPYHAGLKDAERSNTQRKWTDGSCSIAVATVAFGMGIDLPHVRYVIHWTMAKTLEGFYQESGRGGRDGKPSRSILYYSKDDASKFSFLAKVNAERAAKKNGKQNGFSSQKVDHDLSELETMVNYCTTPMCKRKYVLRHFGEEIDANVVCRKTCDYCISPQKVAREIQASECMSTVVNSHRLMHAGRNGQNKGKKYHHNPLDEESLENEYGSDDFLGNDEGLLGITDYAHAGESEMATGGKKGFVKASAVLSKYEAKELEQGKKGGFVNFKTRTFDEPTQEDLEAKRYRAVSVPQHLRKSIPDPLAQHNKMPKEEGLKKSSSYASEAERLQAELAELAKQKAAALAKMGGSLKSLSSRQTSKPIAPPPLTFKRRRPI